MFPEPALGVLAFILLVFTPGAWITFGLPLTGVPAWARLFTGAMLSPLVALVEFYLLRWAGLPFGSTCVALTVVNIPAVYLIVRKSTNFWAGSRGLWIGAGLTVALCLGIMAKPLLIPEVRIFSPHAWLYSDPVYLFARGQLDLEDPTMAGIRLGYPVWSALVFQAIASFLLNAAPASNWVWGNLVWLLMICGFAAGIVRELGGGRMAQGWAGICLLLGTNPVGYILITALPSLGPLRITGDLRYAPWGEKFFLFSTMPLGLGLIGALIYLLVRRTELTRTVVAVAGLLVAATGVLYPLMFPAAAAILGAKALALIAENWKSGERPLIPVGKIAALAVVLLLASAATMVQVKFLEQGRHFQAPPLMFSTPQAAVRKVAAGVLAASVLLAGLAVRFRDLWKEHAGAITLLLSGTAMCWLLHAAFFIPYWDNEYKFIFAASMCLAPFPALALEWIWGHWRRPLAIGSVTLLAALLVLPFLHRYYWHGWYTPNTRLEAVDSSGFYLRLTPSHPWYEVCQAIEDLTPANSVLAVQYSDIYLPALTNRSLYVAPVNRSYFGVNLSADLLSAEIRRNGHEIVDQRRRTLRGLFFAEGADRDDSLARMLGLGRPVAIVAESPHAELVEWLRKRGRGSEVWARGGVSLWLIPPEGGAHAGKTVAALAP